MRTFESVLLAPLAACLLFSNGVPANDSNQLESAEMLDLKAMTCKEVMVLSGDDRDEVVAFFLGYFAGQEKTTELNLTEMGLATDKFLDSCLDNPTANALSTMETAISK